MERNRSAPPMLLLWEALLEEILRRTSKFPVNYRHTLGERIARLTLDGTECIIEAQDPALRTAAIIQMSSVVDKVRLLVRVAHKLGPLDPTGYRLLSERIDELGRMVGGWLAVQRKRDEP